MNLANITQSTLTKGIDNYLKYFVLRHTKISTNKKNKMPNTEPQQKAEY